MHRIQRNSLGHLQSQVTRSASAANASGSTLIAATRGCSNPSSAMLVANPSRSPTSDRWRGPTRMAFRAIPIAAVEVRIRHGTPPAHRQLVERFSVRAAAMSPCARHSIPSLPQSSAATETHSLPGRARCRGVVRRLERPREGLPAMVMPSAPDGVVLLSMLAKNPVRWS